MMALSRVVCPWCGNEVADADNRGAQMLPHHRVKTGATCRGSAQSVLFTIEYDPAGDETGRYQVGPQWPTDGVWSYTYVTDSDWPFPHPNMRELAAKPTEYVKFLVGAQEPRPPTGVAESADETLCDDLDGVADALSVLGAEGAAKLVAEAADRLRSYSDAYRRFIEITESFRVSPRQG